MRTLQSILFATDFQQANDDALNATARLATIFNSQVSVLHVMEPFSKGVIARMREELKQSLLVPAKPLSQHFDPLNSPKNQLRKKHEAFQKHIANLRM